MNCKIPWMCMALFCGSTALCAPSPVDLAAYQNAGARLLTLIATAEEKGQVAELRTPEFMRLVKIVSDEERVLRKDPYPINELGSLFDTCDVANRVSVSLSLFGLKGRLDPKKTGQEMQAAIVSLANSNIVAFQDELKEVQPFLLRCMAKEVQPMTQFMSSLKPAEFTEVRRQGLVQSRSGLLQVYAGALQVANDATYRDEYRISLLAALAESSAHFASVMELHTRRELRDATRIAAFKATGAYKVHLVHIGQALSNETCDGLCAIH